MISKKILAAEDDEFLREMLITVFEEENYQIDAVENGKQAWDLLNKNHYGLLLTDLFMPQMNGMELAEKCKESFPTIKIIIISGGGRDVEAEHGKGLVKLMDKEVEVDVFLKKPCDLDEMLSVVEKLLAD